MTYATNDIALAATLVLHGYRIEKVEPRPDRPAYANFVFGEVEADFLDDYEMDKVAVEPKMFQLKLRNLAGLAQRACRNK